MHTCAQIFEPNYPGVAAILVLALVCCAAETCFALVRVYTKMWYYVVHRVSSEKGKSPNRSSMLLLLHFQESLSLLVIKQNKLARNV